MDNYVRLG